MFRGEEARAPESRMAPEPEGPDDVYRKFERLNRRGGPGRPRLAGLSGRKALYGTFAAPELAAIVGGFFFAVPYLDILAVLLPGLLFLLPGGSGNETDSPEEPESKPAASAEEDQAETPLERLLERLLGRFGVPDSTEDGPR